VLTEHGPALMVVAPVLDGAGQRSPPRGRAARARHHCGRGRASRGAGAGEARHHAGGRRRRRCNPSWLVRHDYVNAVYRQLEDIHGQPAVQLRIEVPRSVSARGRDAIGFALVSLLLAGAVVLLVLRSA